MPKHFLCRNLSIPILRVYNDLSNSYQTIIAPPPPLKKEDKVLKTYSWTSGSDVQMEFAK